RSPRCTPSNRRKPSSGAITRAQRPPASTRPRTNQHHTSRFGIPDVPPEELHPYDFGDGPVIEGRPTVLFCAWLAWCRFRIVIPLRDRTIPSVFAALDTSFRMLGGAPTYVLTDNEKSVTVEHVAGLPVRNVQAVAFGRHYGVTIHTCVPYDPASK